VVPERARREAQALVGLAAADTGVRKEDGATSAWVKPLASLYRDRLRRFVLELAVEGAALGRFEAAQALAASALAVEPGDSDACLVFSVCARKRGRPHEARRVLERALAALEDRGDPALRFELARALAQSGERASALAELRTVLAGVDPSSALGKEAALLLAAIERS
jgi:DNA-binding SARP family transcriptional activator